MPPRYAHGSPPLDDYTGTVAVSGECVRVVHVDAIRALQFSAYALAPSAAD